MESAPMELSPAFILGTVAVTFVLGVGVAFLIFRYLVPGYLSEKGKNIATKEDIEEITRKVETIRADYAVLLEEVRGRNQLRLAAVDKRLEAHQEAFTLWKKLHGQVFSEKIMDVVLECQDFWNRNCLYLSPEVREAFLLSYNYAANHRELVKAERGRGPEGKAIIEASMSTITAPGNLIPIAVNLPPLTDRELRDLKSPEGEKDA